MKRTAIMVAGGLIAGVLVGGPAQAARIDDLGVTDVCGDEFILVGQTTIGGSPGRPHLGDIVQAFDPLTRDACAYVALTKDHGTTGTLTITTQSAAAETPGGAWDETDVSDDKLDLDDSFASDPTFFAFPEDARASISIVIVGTAPQGRAGDKKTVVVPATKAEKKAAKRAYKKAVKAARKAMRAHGDEQRFKRAVKRAKERRDGVLDGHTKRVKIKAGATEPFRMTATRTFGL